MNRFDMNNKADIFIPTSRSAKILGRCLQSLMVQSEKKFQLIIVGKNTNTSIEKIIKKCNKKLAIQYILQEKPGLVGAANTALRYSRSPIFIRIDDDVIVSKKWLPEILFLFKDTKVGGVTGPTYIQNKDTVGRDSISFYDRLLHPNAMMKYVSILYNQLLYEGKMFAVGIFLSNGAFSIGSNFKECIPTTKPFEVMNVEGCNFAVKTSLLKRIGGFDTTFQKGLGEYHEADIALKIRSEGKIIIFNPKAFIYHKIQNNLDSTRPDAYNRVKNYLIFYKRYFKIKSLSTLIRFILYLGMQNLYYFYKFLSSRDSSQLGAWLGTIDGLLYSDEKNK
ncbi:MAG: glycosyltransferase [bacterium]|nr:glycosyltransferase [bacterium]